MSDNTTIKEEGELVLEMTRTFKASRERVFDAWSSLEAMTQWFGPGDCQVLTPKFVECRGVGGLVICYE